MPCAISIVFGVCTVLTVNAFLPPKPPRWPSDLGVLLESGRSGIRFRLRRDFSGSSHISDLKIDTSVATCQASGVLGQHCDWLAWCQYTVTECDKKFDLQLLSQCGSTCTCPSRSVPYIHQLVAGDVKQPKSTTTVPPPAI